MLRDSFVRGVPERLSYATEMSSPSAGKRRMDTDVIKLYPFMIVYYVCMFWSLLRSLLIVFVVCVLCVDSIIFYDFQMVFR